MTSNTIPGPLWHISFTFPGSVPHRSYYSSLHRQHVTTIRLPSIHFPLDSKLSLQRQSLSLPILTSTINSPQQTPSPKHHTHITPKPFPLRQLVSNLSMARQSNNPLNSYSGGSSSQYRERPYSSRHYASICGGGHGYGSEEDYEDYEYAPENGRSFHRDPSGLGSSNSRYRYGRRYNYD